MYADLRIFVLRKYTATASSSRSITSTLHFPITLLHQTPPRRRPWCFGVILLPLGQPDRPTFASSSSSSSTPYFPVQRLSTNRSVPPDYRRLHVTKTPWTISTTKTSSRVRGRLTIWIASRSAIILKKLLYATGCFSAGKGKSTSVSLRARTATSCRQRPTYASLC
jgi:hypothetical protein